MLRRSLQRCASSRTDAPVALRGMTEQPQPPPTPGERPLWKLDRGEQRVLAITFVGGVASIVAAAVIVGGAIALARAYSHVSGRHPTAIRNDLPNVVYIGSAVILLTFGVLAAVGWGPKWLGGDNILLFHFILRVALIVAGIIVLLFIVILLTLIGAAAGIH
jgi:hypothetical protein